MNKKSQHFVPEFQLKLFGNCDKDTNHHWIWILNKDDKTLRKKGTRNALKVNHLYSSFDSEGNPNPATEDYLSFLETNLSKLVQKIDREYRKENPRFSEIISIQDKALLAIHASWQMKRTEFFFKDMANKFLDDIGKQRIETINQIPKEDKNYLVYILDHLGEQDYNFHEIIYSRNLIFTLILEKLRTGFVISDNPVMMTNAVENTGLAQPNTEITLPLTCPPKPAPF